MGARSVAREILAVARELLGANVLRYRGHEWPVIRLKSQWDLPKGYLFFAGFEHADTLRKAVSRLPSRVLDDVEGIAEIDEGPPYGVYYKAYYRTD